MIEMYSGVRMKDRKILVSPAELICHDVSYCALKNALIKKCTGKKSSGLFFLGGCICFTFNKSDLPKWKVSERKVSIIISDGLKKEIAFPRCTEKPVMMFVAVLEVARHEISMSGDYVSS